MGITVKIYLITKNIFCSILNCLSDRRNGGKVRTRDVLLIEDTAAEVTAIEVT